MLVEDLEKELDNLSEELSDKINDFCRTTRLMVKRKLENGEYFSEPDSTIVYLEDTSYKKESWFKKKLAYLETKWEELEKMKKNNMDEYGNETVLVDAPRKSLKLLRMIRKSCYEKGYEPRIPFRYDFLSLRGKIKILDNAYALDKKTNEIFSVKEDIIHMVKLSGQSL